MAEKREFGHLSANGVKAAWRRCDQWRVKGVKMSLKQWARWWAAVARRPEAPVPMMVVLAKDEEIAKYVEARIDPLCAGAAWAQDDPIDRQAIVQVTDVTGPPASSQESLSQAVAVRMVASILRQRPTAPATEQLQVQKRSWFPTHLVPGFNPLGNAWRDAQSLLVWGGQDIPSPELRSLAKSWALQSHIALRQAAPVLLETGQWPETHEMMRIAAGAERAVSAWAAHAARQTTGAESLALSAISRTTGAVAIATQWCADNYQTFDDLTDGQLDAFLRSGL